MLLLEWKGENDKIKWMCFLLWIFSSTKGSNLITQNCCTKVKNSLHSLPRTPGQLIQRLKVLARIWKHHCKLTWDGKCGCVWQASEASRPPSSRISFSFGWWTVSNSTSFGRSWDTDASFCRRHAEHREISKMITKKAFLQVTSKLSIMCSVCF